MFEKKRKEQIYVVNNDIKFDKFAISKFRYIRYKIYKCYCDLVY